MSIVLHNPVPGSTLTGGFGWRPAFTENGVHVPAMLHDGQDLAAPAGTPILAAHDGRISRKWWDAWASGVAAGGNAVAVTADGYETRSYHMREQSHLAVGTQVRAGDVIGHVGSTGMATGAHLHFTLINGKSGAVDPMPYMNGDEDLTEEERAMLKDIHYTLTGGKAGVKGQGEVNRLLHELPKKTADEIFNRKFKRRGGTQTGETSLGAVIGWFDAMFEHTIGKILKK